MPSCAHASVLHTHAMSTHTEDTKGYTPFIFGFVNQKFDQNKANNSFKQTKTSPVLDRCARIRGALWLSDFRVCCCCACCLLSRIKRGLIGGNKVEDVGVVKDKELKLEEIEA